MKIWVVWFHLRLWEIFEGSWGGSFANTPVAVFCSGNRTGSDGCVSWKGSPYLTSIYLRCWNIRNHLLFLPLFIGLSAQFLGHFLRLYHYRFGGLFQYRLQNFGRFGSLMLVWKLSTIWAVWTRGGFDLIDMDDFPTSGRWFGPKIFLTFMMVLNISFTDHINIRFLQIWMKIFGLICLRFSGPRIQDLLVFRWAEILSISISPLQMMMSIMPMPMTMIPFLDDIVRLHFRPHFGLHSLIDTGSEGLVLIWGGHHLWMIL